MDRLSETRVASTDKVKTIYGWNENADWGSDGLSRALFGSKD